MEKPQFLDMVFARGHHPQGTRVSTREPRLTTVPEESDIDGSRSFRIAFMQQDSPHEARNSSWSNPTSDDEAARRAAGRARYNSVRQLNAMVRRGMLVDDWRQMARNGGSLFDYGARARLAKEFGVHRSTITRDLAILKTDLWLVPCPTCSSPVKVSGWREKERRGEVRITER